ncbi:uncharacterized protein [Halyomorpha halys]|uniref:uncharacterized protein n=1 Tax=Halyomorpha halys TaxID=286706 RepID=UPI0006D4EE43|nr:uncharacterized protein LOC106681733 [Halyomorpha halys]
MKVLTTALVLGALAFLQVTSDSPSAYYQSSLKRYNRDSYTWGQRREGERLLYETRVRYSDNVMRQYLLRHSGSPRMRYGFAGKVTVDVDLPLADQRLGGFITFIEAHNLARSRGYACLTRGGIGFDWVTLHFVSNYNKDIDYVVRVFGF